MDMKIGHGFDVHRFKKGNLLRLCGIDIEFDRELDGHSDADVALHALTDALLGALGKGDIGRWFPPSDERWKDADSSIFLKFANDKMYQEGYSISNIDLTIICEQPKINQYSEKMKKWLKKILKLDLDTINIKATTTESLGFTGRKEGIAVLCTVLLVKS